MAPTLHSILSNELLLLSITPHLLPIDLLNLSLTSTSFSTLILHSRSVWRHLDLSTTSSLAPTTTATTFLTTPRPSLKRYQLDPAVLLSRSFALRDLRTLILDGLPNITTEFLHDILKAEGSKLQLLSIRECGGINENQFMLLLQYLVRPSRPEGSPGVKGIYYFSDKDAPRTQQLESGRFVPTNRITNGWADILRSCQGVIAFDTKLCEGPRHEDGENAARLASVRILEGCARCGESPQARKKSERTRVLVPPVPLTSSDIRIACRGGGEKTVFRCEGCVRERWCEGCGKWWCEDCADLMRGEKKLVSLDCYECGSMCAECSMKTTRTCKSCRGEYCITHNEGADNTWCEWCKTPERRNRPVHIVTVQRPHQQMRQMFTSASQRERTMKRLNALRKFMGPTSGGVFLDEGMKRRRCVVGS